MQCSDFVIERKVDEKITQFIDKVKKHPNQKHQVRDPSFSIWPSGILAK